jgi:hypothetical protein
MTPTVDGPNRTANHGLVPGSCSTSGSAEGKEFLDCVFLAGFGLEPYQQCLRGHD